MKSLQYEEKDIHVGMKSFVQVNAKLHKWVYKFLQHGRNLHVKGKFGQVGKKSRQDEGMDANVVEQNKILQPTC